VGGNFRGWLAPASGKMEKGRAAAIRKTQPYSLIFPSPVWPVCFCGCLSMSKHSDFLFSYPISSGVSYFWGRQPQEHQQQHQQQPPELLNFRNCGGGFTEGRIAEYGIHIVCVHRQRVLFQFRSQFSVIHFAPGVGCTRWVELQMKLVVTIPYPIVGHNPRMRWQPRQAGGMSR